jgi:carbon-monoxide dehydrogenase large subunit
VGIGINLYVEPCGTGWESARITRHADGRVVVASGSSAQGQGHRTAFAQIAADALGVDLHQIEVIEGDSDSAPAGIGALASRSTAIGGSAILKAAQALRARLKSEPGARDTSIEVEAVYEAEAEAWSAGCCIALASVDTATGEVRVERAFWVDDAGLVVNPLLFEGQLHGGFAQGLGQALMERIHYDREGQIVTGSLMDYAVPRADGMPPLVHASRPSRTAANPLGAKGVGESGCIAAPAAILNAVMDALVRHGVTQLQLPLTSERVWQALQDAAIKSETGDTRC